MGRTLQLSPPHRLPLYVVAVAAGLAMSSFCSAPERSFANLLLDAFYLLSLGVSGLFFLAIQRLAGARWSSSLRRWRKR